MDVIVQRDAEQATASAADLILSAVAAKPDSVFGLATGATMEPLYARLVAAPASTFSRCRFFSLDEYVGLSPNDPHSFHAYLETRFFRPAGISPEQVTLIRGNADDPAAEARRYEAAVAAQPIDLQLLGLGHNGHIGFNEPPSEADTRTRVIDLTKSTIAENAYAFGDEAHVPRQAITMGIGTILDARRIVLIATGSGKKDAVRGMLKGPVQPTCPASALQRHPNVTVILDRSAAGEVA